MYDAVNEKVLNNIANGDPKSSNTEVKNQATVRKETGRIATARKTGTRGGAKTSQGAKRKSGAS